MSGGQGRYMAAGDAWADLWSLSQPENSFRAVSDLLGGVSEHSYWLGRAEFHYPASWAGRLTAVPGSCLDHSFPAAMAELTYSMVPSE